MFGDKWDAPETPILLYGPGATLETSFVGIASILAGPAPLKNSLGGWITFPPSNNPPILSFVIGWEKLPPPTRANFCDNIFGKEYICPA